MPARADEVERADPTRGKRRPLKAFLVFLAYLAGAIVSTIGAWSDPRSGWAGGCCDQQQTIWFLGWTPHALANGLNPFFTTQIAAPDGVNLMWNTPMILLGLLGWLPAKVGGPIFAFNVLMIVGIALSGLTAWVAIRRWTGDGVAPAVGGAVYAFSPYVASHAAMHLNLATAWVPPLLLCVIDDLLVTRRRPPWQAGVALGVLATAQLLITEEVLATSVVASVVLVCVMALVRRDGKVRARWSAGAARLVPALAVATITFLVLAAGPLFAQFFGPQRISGQVQHPETFSTDLLNVILPTPYQLIAPGAATKVSREFSGLYHEATAYLGLPLLVLLVVAAVRLWDDLRARIASVTGALLLLLSLGPWLHIGKEKLPVPLPWLPIGKLPLLHHVLPGRFTLYVWLSVAVIVAIVIKRATRLAPGPAARWLLAVAAAIVFILPAPLGRQPFYTPDFFRNWASQHIGPDETVLVAPYFTNGMQAAPMVWAAEADYGLRMPEAYAYVPLSDGRTSSGPPPTRLFKVMRLIQEDKTSFVARGEVRAQIIANLRFAQVRHVIVGPMEGVSEMLAFFTDLFGRPPERVEGIAIWRDVNVRGVVAAPD
ncbi:hypothetical protein BST27_23560 [Mycobacterium intermedium]|uniref:DUF6311 domain-containing protein n=1 Tax=Mycobacterium intermedium TaxID=28445 RepID=A0A1X0F5F1_MYCIE|nr:glycosyltransferase family 87 protein [Mycobacterium intermedium]MCV6962719.1 hypothetical protein [Mycobacterium intermedium]ORA96950.1 hypothetical protein BST27_23560 [Mycobacterium intermedium]